MFVAESVAVFGPVECPSKEGANCANKADYSKKNQQPENQVCKHALQGGFVEQADTAAIHKAFEVVPAGFADDEFHFKHPFCSPSMTAGFYEIYNNRDYCGEYSHCILAVFSTEKKCNHIVKNAYEVKAEVSNYRNTEYSCNLFQCIHPFHLTMIITGSVHMVKKIIAVATAI